MKKTFTAIVTIIFLLTPAICFSAYRIHLKDGREFVTDRYWKDGDQIKFKRFGGMIGMQKELVRKIEEVEDIPEQVETGQELPSKEGMPQKEGKEPPLTGSSGGEKQQEVQEDERADQRSETGKREEMSEENKKGEEDKAAERETILEEKKRLNTEMNRVYSEYKKARSEGNKKTRKECLLEFSALRKKFDELERKVKVAHEGELPEWWNDAK